MSGMRFYGKKICFLGAHPDDIELGCGALIARIAEKADVHCVTFSNNQKNPALHKLLEEHYASMQTLGIARKQVELLEFETRHFQAHRQEILDAMIGILRRDDPDIVFVHSPSDIHQDHGVLTQEALRAFRGRTVLGFEVIRSSHGFFPNFLVGVEEADVCKKLNALACYKTYEGKHYFSPEVTRATLLRNGLLCDRTYAEGFDILRIVADFA